MLCIVKKYFRNSVAKSDYIKILEFGEKMGLKPRDNIKNKDYEYLLKNFNLDKSKVDTILHECFHRMENKQYVLKMKYYAKLIEYRELQLATKSAKEAKTQSNWAVGIAIASLITSALLGIFQITNEVNLSKDTIDKLNTKYQLQKSTDN